MATSVDLIDMENPFQDKEQKINTKKAKDNLERDY